MGSRAAAILDKELQVLGKVPVAELPKTLENFKGAEAIVVDGEISPTVLESAEKSKVKYLVVKETDAKSRRVKIVTEQNLA